MMLIFEGYLGIFGIIIEIIGFMFLLDEMNQKLRNVLERMHQAGNKPRRDHRYKLVGWLVNHTRRFAIYLVVFGLFLQLMEMIT